MITKTLRRLKWFQNLSVWSTEVLWGFFYGHFVGLRNVNSAINSHFCHVYRGWMNFSNVVFCSLQHTVLHILFAYATLPISQWNISTACNSSLFTSLYSHQRSKLLSSVLVTQNSELLHKCLCKVHGHVLPWLWRDHHGTMEYDGSF